MTSRRDLEDFSRLWVYVGGLQEAIASGKVRVGLKWKNTTGSPSINIYEHVESDGGTKYLTDTATAAQQVPASTLRQVVPNRDNQYVSVTTGSTFIFNQSFWNGLSSARTNKYLLFEGCTEGKGQLVLTFHKPDGTEIGEAPGVWLDLKNIKKMYERAKGTPEGIAAPNGDVTEPFTGPMSYVDDPNGQLFEAALDEEKKAVIFVHGWSVDYSNYSTFSETLFKRLWHQGYKGRVCALRWEPLVVQTVADIPYTAGEYNRSEHRAWLYGESLKQFAETIKGQGFDVSLLGHSMGNVVCGSALQMGLTVTNYLLLEAAIRRVASTQVVIRLQVESTAISDFGIWKPASQRRIIIRHRTAI